MVSIHALVSVLLTTGSLTASRAETNADVFVAHQVATQTFEADLQQTFHWTFPPRHVESLGHLSYQAPDFLAIVLTNPAAELVLERGDDLYIKRDGKRLAKYKLEVRNGKPTQNVQFLLSFFQNGCTNFAGLFDVSVTTTNDARTATLASAPSAPAFSSGVRLSPHPASKTTIAKTAHCFRVPISSVLPGPPA